MLRQFYTKALPKQGVYCVSGIESEINGKKITNHFTESIDGVLDHIEKLKNKNLNVFVAMGAFNGYRRSKETCLFYKSLFIDLDVGEDKVKTGKGYGTKEEALTALDNFILEQELPPAIKIDSGTGIHAYWLFTDDVPFAVYEPVAVKFKKFVLAHLFADPSVMADGARIMRCPETFNQKTIPPSPSGFISTEFIRYPFQAFKDFLGETQEDIENDIFASISKGLDEDTKSILKLDNFSYSFTEIVKKSIAGSGCKQILNIVMDQVNISRDLWAGGLTVAVKCADGETAIHKMSDEHPQYDYGITIRTANSFEKPRTCEWFDNNAPDICTGCKHKGKIKSPIVLGRELKEAKEPEYEPISDSLFESPTPTSTPTFTKNTSIVFPKFLKPFARGENGGVYYIPPTKVDKEGVSHQDDPVLLISHDLYPIQRLYSNLDGECLTMRLILPNDAVREFLLPMKDVYSQDRFKSVMSSNGVIYNPMLVNHLTQYIVKWGQYMVETTKADIMRMQMGWTAERIDEDQWTNKSFVIGHTEIQNDGTTVLSAASPYVRGTARHLEPAGSFANWQASANRLNTPGLELHAFTMLSGFGSPLMSFTSTAGISVSLLGRSGCAKTGALYAALSVFGNPKDLSVFDATGNGMVGRYLALHNLMLGVDEIGGKDPKELSLLIHKISHGKAKIKMQASVNAEREHEMSASLIAVFTTNVSIYNKLESVSASPDGEAARLIEFFVKKPEILNGVDGSVIGKEIFDPFRFNFGHAGPMFIKEVLRLGDDYINRTMKYWGDRFLRDFRSGDSAYRFYENIIQASMTAGTIAVGAGIIDLDIERIYETVVREMIHIKDKVITVNKIDYQSVLGDFVNKNMANILILKDGKLTMEPRGQLVARVDTDKGVLQVSRTVFKKYLSDSGISSREFETTMRELRIMNLTDSRVRLTAGWKSSVSLEPVWCYVFNTQFPAEWSESDVDVTD